MAKISMPVTGSSIAKANEDSVNPKNTASVENDTPVTESAEAPENPAIDDETGEMIPVPPAPGAENADITKTIESGANLAGATKASPQTIDPTPQGTPGGVISDPSVPAPQADSTLSQTDRDPDPGTDAPGLRPNVVQPTESLQTINTANPDPWREGEVEIEEIEQIDKTAYTYKHRTVRNYRVHKFFFENHLMTVFGEDERNEFIALWKKLPSEERSQIVEYHPEKMAQLESPVDAPRVVQGIAGSGMYPDNRAANMRSDGQKTAIDKMRTQHHNV